MSKDHRISWFWNTSTSIDLRDKIDKWYNSLTKEEHLMIDEIIENAQAQKQWDRLSEDELNTQ